jgi:glycine cleavage system regulatory protein
MSTSIVLTVIGDDHPGIVKSLSDVLASHGGNWNQSSMSSLAGQFAGILLATVPDDQAEACATALRGLAEEGLQVVVKACVESTPGPKGEIYLLDLVGHDRPGIVQEITHVLTRHGVNVDELETDVASASMAGGPLFKARAQLLVPAEVDVSVLVTDLEAIANELMVEFHPEH